VRLNNGVTSGTHYYWQIDSLPETYTGFVQCKELYYGLISPWVRVESQVDPSESNLNIYARLTAYPQYTEAFSSYVVKQGDMMIVHWKTNIDPPTDNLSTLYLEIYDNGDNITPAYSVSLATLGTDYYKGSTTNVNAGIHWRFALFSPKVLSGTNTYGGLINNLNLDFVPDNKGYLQAMIRSATLGEVTLTHSAYWYLTSATDGIAVTMTDNTLTTDQEIGVKVAIGRECNVENYLKYIIVSITETGIATGTFVGEGDNQLYIDAVNAIGDYTLQVALYDDSITSYQYVYQIPFSVTASGIAPTTHPTVTEEDIWAWITDLMHKWHLDTTGGHWLLILIGMGIMLLIGYKTEHKTIGLTGALLVFALGIVVGWIDWWWIVLLALGAGFTVWQFIRSKASGSGAG